LLLPEPVLPELLPEVLGEVLLGEDDELPPEEELLGVDGLLGVELLGVEDAPPEELPLAPEDEDLK